MTICNDTERRTDPTIDGDDLRTPSADAVLVRTPTERHQRTARSEVDVHTAITTGLAAYISGLESAIDGRYIAITRVVADWADHDDGAVAAPSAAVYSTEVGRYQTDTAVSQGAPIPIGPDASGKVTALSAAAVYKLEELEVHVMCEDKLQRAGVRRMLEDAFAPVEWMAGFRLVLPRYHNAIAEYLLISAQQPDASNTAQASIWPLTMRLMARCPTYRVHVLPLARPVARGTVA